MNDGSSKNIERLVLLILIILLVIDLLFTQFLLGSNRLNYQTPRNVIVLSILFMLFLWRNGVIISKTGGYIVNKTVLENEKNRKRVDYMFYVWYFLLGILFYFFNSIPFGDEYFYLKNKAYFQFFGFLVVIFIVYNLIKSLKETKKNNREALKNKVN